MYILKLPTFCLFFVIVQYGFLFPEDKNLLPQNTNLALKQARRYLVKLHYAHPQMCLTKASEWQSKMLVGVGVFF